MLARSLSRSCAHLQGRHPIHVLLLEVVVQTSAELQGQAGDLDLLPDLDESGNGHGAGELDVRSEVGDVDRVAATRAGHPTFQRPDAGLKNETLSLSLSGSLALPLRPWCRCPYRSTPSERIQNLARAPLFSRLSSLVAPLA